jgi:hypothetical protein
MNIIGLGNCGCNIAQKFSKYSQYSIYLFDSSGESLINIEEQDSHEKYESSFSWPNSEIKHGESIFICSSSGTISGCSLKLLEHFKNTQIRIVLIISEEGNSIDQYHLQHKLIFNALQDYARSGVFKDIVLISNESIENTISDLTFLNRFDKMNEVISYSLHMLNIFENTRPIAETKLSHKEHARILSIGTYDYEKDEEKMYFSLDKPGESVYYVSIPQQKLETDMELVKTMKNNFRGKENSAYQIFSNQHDQDYGFVVKKTFFHQGQKLS